MTKGKATRKNLLLIATVSLLMLLCACGKETVKIDYGNEKVFEAALNAGEVLEGKVVQFTADELHPDSAFGYDIWSGEHLNFISTKNPGVKEGELVTVRVKEVNSILGSWMIAYEIVKDAEKDANTLE